MKKVFEQALNYVVDNGTEFQQTCCSNILGQASDEQVADALARYQNVDGGFAHGLEIEYQGPISSPFTTAAALGHIFRFGLKNTTVLSNTLGYLKNSQYPDGKWDDPEELDDYPHPPYMGAGVYPEFKTGMILKWLLRLNCCDQKEMMEKAQNYLLDNFEAISPANDFWSAVAYAGAFALLPHLPEYSAIMEWSMKILMPETTAPNWQQISGMIEDEVPIPEANLNQALQMIKEHQEQDGGWPHLYGTYNRVWSAIYILRFLKLG